MKYYVYKVTNKNNNKYYIGKRKHRDPEQDSYLGSGKLIKLAVEKYGKESFLKEIVEIFDTNDEAAALEAQLVSKVVARDNKSYNMHEGGHGGFAHLNTGDEAHRERARRGAKNNIHKTKNIIPYQFKKGDERTRVLSQKANAKRKIEGLTEEHKANIAKSRRNNNIAYKNMRWIENKVTGDRLFVNKEDIQSFDSSIWISATEKKAEKESKMKMRWINKNGKNMLIRAQEYDIYLDNGWKVGRVSNRK